MQINKIFIVCLTLTILSISASAQSQDIYSVLKTHIYVGQPPNMSDEAYSQTHVLVSFATQGDILNDSANFPLLINYNSAQIKCFLDFSISKFLPCKQINEIHIPQFTFSEISIANYSILEAITIPTEYSLRNRAFYIMENDISWATFLYPFASVYKPNEAPFYQEVIQSASASQLAFPGVQDSKLKDFVFYHLPRTDHYLETIGFYTPSQNFSKLNGTQKIFAFHTLYPQEMQQNLAKPMLHLLRQETRFHEKAWR